MATHKELVPFSNFVIFQTESGKVNVDVFFQNDTLWLTQKTMAELFEKSRSTITEHLRPFQEGELDEHSVCRNFRHTASDGKLYDTKYYNLRAITTVGYRVNSHRARRGVVMNMKDWVTYLDKFLDLSDYPILLHKGKVSALEAKIKAEAEYEKYRVLQDRQYVSDFDRIIQATELPAKNTTKG